MPAIIDLQIADPAAGQPSAMQCRQWVGAALAMADQCGEVELTIRIVAADEMTRLNDTYRGKARPTNVLSFPADLPPELDIGLLGDIVVCHTVVADEAKQQNKPLEHHWAHMIIHGTLHLLGYDHIDDDDAEVMESLEIAALATLNIPNPYNHSPHSEDSTQNYERRSI